MLRCEEYEDDYIGQQIAKLNADNYTDAPLIAHIDSDCMFCAPCSLPTTLLTGRAIPIGAEASGATAPGARVC